MSPADPPRGQEPCEKQVMIGHRGRKKYKKLVKYRINLKPKAEKDLKAM